MHEYIEQGNFELNMAHDKADFAALYERIGQVLTSYNLDMRDSFIRRTAVEGALFSATSYSHLPSMETKVFIGVYTALIIQVDDTCESSEDVLNDAINFSIVSPFHLISIDLADYVPRISCRGRLRAHRRFKPCATISSLAGTCWSRWRSLSLRSPRFSS